MCWRYRVAEGGAKIQYGITDKTPNKYSFFYRQLDCSSEPGVANEIFENEPESCFV